MPFAPQGVGDVTETTMSHPIALRWSRFSANKKMGELATFVQVIATAFGIVMVLEYPHFKR